MIVPCQNTHHYNNILPHRFAIIFIFLRETVKTPKKDFVFTMFHRIPPPKYSNNISNNNYYVNFNMINIVQNNWIIILFAKVNEFEDNIPMGYEVMNSNRNKLNLFSFR